MAYEWLDTLGGYNLVLMNISPEEVPFSISLSTVTRRGNTPVSLSSGSSLVPFDNLWDFSDDLRFGAYSSSNSWRQYVQDKANNVILFDFEKTGLSPAPTNIDFGIAIDYDNERAYPILINTLGQYPGHYNVENNLGGNPTTEHRFFELLEIITYNWQSVPSISGKNGILPLTMLKSELITGDTQQNLTASDFTRITGESRIEQIIANNTIPIGAEIPLFYSGLVDYLALYRYDASTYYLRLHMAGGSAIPYMNCMYNATSSYRHYLAFIIDDENQVAKYVNVIEDNDTYTFDAMPWTDEQMAQWWLFIHSSYNEENDDTDEEINEPDNDEPYSDDWHDIPITGLTVPTKSAVDTGFTSMYEVTDIELKSLANELWTDSIISNLGKFFNDPREIIVGLSIMPVKPDAETTPSTIKAGNITTNTQGYRLNSQYVIYPSAGNEWKIHISEGKRRKFLCYPPYTSISINLPFCGSHSLDVNQIMGKELSLRYIFDFLTGACVAEISVDGEPKYFFGGSCGVQIPTSSQDFSRAYSGILSAGSSLGSTLATKATGGMIAPMAIGIASNALANFMNMTPQVSYSSGSGSVNGMLGVQTAYLVIEYPIEKIAKNQNHFVGRASMITSKLEDCSGFIKCLSVHLDNIACLETERNEIENLLLNGVRIETGSETPTYTGNKQAIIFLKCISDKDVIGKTWLQNTLEQPNNILTLEGKLLYDKDILNPTVLISGDILAYNYCYIPLLNRFYYITGITARTGAQEEINLKCDVLQSWKSGILDNTAILERSENLYSSKLNDSMTWTQQNKKVVVNPFVDSQGHECKFDRANNCYILTIAGG